MVCKYNAEIVAYHIGCMVDYGGRYVGLRMASLGEPQETVSHPSHDPWVGHLGPYVGPASDSKANFPFPLTTWIVTRISRSRPPRRVFVLVRPLAPRSLW